MARLWRLALFVGATSIINRLFRNWRAADLRGETVLITGGSRGLGLLLAREFAQAGCRVAICARDEAELDGARAALNIPGLLTVTCDVSDGRQVAEMIETVNREFGRIDILVNNAGIIQVGPIWSQRLADFEQAMDVMYWGVVYPTLGVLSQMRQRRSGRIVNITSIGGKLSAPHLLPYCAAKFAATGFSEGLHAEVMDHGIHVTTVIPGLMRTGSHLNAYFKGDEESEFTWFGLADTLPGSSMPAEQAAREIVQAVKRGDAEIILSMPAKLAARFHGLFPGTTATLLGVVNRQLLPPDSRDATLKRGLPIFARLSPTLQKLMSLGSKPAQQYQFHAEAVEAPPIEGPAHGVQVAGWKGETE
ncbi:MAG: SDR family NAD(P)-dependent oxidoreductase [Chloroflexi bacterium]|nr:SDR family NAD(P)-dependent oxidoreductase [Chloroflexota bacterium]